MYHNFGSRPENADSSSPARVRLALRDMSMTLITLFWSQGDLAGFQKTSRPALQQDRGRS